LIDFICCGGCGEQLHADERHAGDRVKCRHGHINVVPTPLFPPPGQSRPGDGASSARTAYPPSYPTRSAGGNPRGVGQRWGGAVVLVLLGAALSFWAGRHQGLREAAVASALQSPARPRSGDEWTPPRQAATEQQLDASGLRPVQVTSKPPKIAQAQSVAHTNAIFTQVQPAPTGVERLPEQPLPVLQPTPERPLHPRSLRTGQEWGVASERGLGSLRIENGTNLDAVVALFDTSSSDPREARRAVYVRTSETATITGIAVGTYALKFKLGLDWEEATRSFTFDSSCSEFVDPMTYTETQTNEATFYRVKEVTLQAVPGGNARTKTIDAAQFDLSRLVRVPGKAP
jgi:hypothetical protein